MGGLGLGLGVWGGVRKLERDVTVWAVPTV